MHMLALGALEVLEVLLEGGFIKLCEEIGLGRRVKAANVIDQLTFGHGRFTFGLARWS